jgi:trans-aconitate methyltransferase
MNGARFFQWLQSADFYRALHAEAVATVPATGGRWLDVGCGPGLVTSLAAARGFEALGVDPSAAMVAAARSRTPGARFEQASVVASEATAKEAEVAATRSHTSFEQARLASGATAQEAVVAATRSHTSFDQARLASGATAARSHTPGARFEQASLDDLVTSGATAHVVSAASLVLVLRDPRAGLEALWQLVEPGGRLLVIETMPALRFTKALRHARGFGDVGLVLWGLARSGRSVAPLLDAFTPPDLASATHHPLCAGLVGAWSFTRRPSQELHP